MRSVHFGSNDPDGPLSDFLIPAPLAPEELRVLGCLLEKQFLTPDVYPMTLNGLVTACNQKTSREPVTSYDDDTVERTLMVLQAKGLATKISGVSRVEKYRELLLAKTGLRVSEIAVLTALMLRGSQTLNELRTRTNRIHEFADEADVEATVDRLIARERQPLAVKLPHLAGTREARYMHLLAGEVDASMIAAAPPPPREDRSARLEAEIAALKDRIADLERQFAEFRRQFE